ncbi:unnamed protein product [Chironomus riparius]|uniref:Uncharacterized protein n=1 Tax=Chironomus riparius TaxID=315576 RepID=A0A9N9S7R3_9DIPT|nr:unnamed protein product [Chironomus riparius]
MTKIVLLLFCVIGVNLDLSASTSIECSYKTRDWNIVQNVYHCPVNKNPRITTRESAAITSISGTHQNGMTNSDVGGFYAYSRTINYFPRGLETFFKTIKIIQIYDCNLKEVHQEDLKPFPNLVELYLRFNDLEVLEEGLFDFNPDLHYIGLNYNKIVYIGPNVFDHLTKLRDLSLHSNLCISKEAKNSISEVKNVIQAIKSQCNINTTTTTTTQPPTTTQAPTTTTQAPTTTSTTPKSINFESCLELESKIDNIASSLKDLIGQPSNEAFSNNNNQCEAFTEALRNQSEAIGRIDNRTEALTEAMDTKLEILKENVENTRTLSLRQMQNFKDEVKADHAELLDAIRLRTDKIEKNIEELNQKLTNIMKALKIDS